MPTPNIDTKCVDFYITVSRAAIQEHPTLYRMYLGDNYDRAMNELDGPNDTITVCQRVELINDQNNPMAMFFYHLMTMPIKQLVVECDGQKRMVVPIGK